VWAEKEKGEEERVEENVCVFILWRKSLHLEARKKMCPKDKEQKLMNRAFNKVSSTFTS